MDTDTEWNGEDESPQKSSSRSKPLSQLSRQSSKPSSSASAPQSSKYMSAVSSGSSRPGFKKPRSKLKTVKLQSQPTAISRSPSVEVIDLCSTEPDSAELSATSRRLSELGAGTEGTGKRSAPPAKKTKLTHARSSIPVFDMSASQSQSQSHSNRVVRSQTSFQSESEGMKSKSTTAKGKGKASARDDHTEFQDDQLWIDRYEPLVEADLAVHKRKVEDVRRWLSEALDGGPSGKLRKYRRILVLTGPAGTGKTATIRVLSREMGFGIVEWRNGMNLSEKFGRPSGTRDWSDRGTRGRFDDENGSDDGSDDDNDPSQPWANEALFDKFEAFLTRASACSSIFSSGTQILPSTSMTTSESRKIHANIPSNSGPASSSWQSQLATPAAPSRHIILLEDLPNILHAPTQARFHAALRALAETSASDSSIFAPIVIIVSDAGVRGEAGDEREIAGIGGSGGAGAAWAWARREREVVDARSVLGPELTGSKYVTQVSFNPIAPTLLRRALQSLVTSHYSSTKSHAQPPSKEFLDLIVESSNGDIRSAIMTLQFACIVERDGRGSTSFSSAPSSKHEARSKKGKKRMDKVVVTSALLEVVSRREQNLALFHLMGKVFYNKRKNDPPSASASVKDIQKDRELDAHLPHAQPLPSFLSHHERRTSRINVETIYSDSPVDSSLFGLYIHQNYTLFTEDVDQCADITEWLSWVDWGGSDTPSFGHPHAFHLLALGTLHSLPSPVSRRSQKICKPAFFDVRKKEIEAAASVRDITDWLSRGGASSLGPPQNIVQHSGHDHLEPESEEANGKPSSRRWSQLEVATESGGWLKAVDKCLRPGTFSQGQAFPSHHLFSHLPFTVGTLAGLALDERENDLGQDIVDDDYADATATTGERTNEGEKRENGGWLETDDIEDAE